MWPIGNMHISRLIVGSRAHPNLTNVSQQSIILPQFTFAVDLNAKNNMHSISGIALTNAQHVCMGDLWWYTGIYCLLRRTTRKLKLALSYCQAQNERTQDESNHVMTIYASWTSSLRGESLGIPPTEFKIYCTNALTSKEFDCKYPCRSMLQISRSS